ncbi:MAG: beta strand repeat-containing protein, partial [Roseimicrobium sp.]
ATITITNNTSKDLLVNRLDASQRGAGTLVIYDKAGGKPSAGTTDPVNAGTPYTSIYQWTPTGVSLSTNGSSNPSYTGTTTLLGGYSHLYNPAAGWRYGWTTEVDQNLIKRKHVESGSWGGFIPDVFASENIEWDSIQVQGTPHYAGSGPYYYKYVNTASDLSGATSATDAYNYKQTTVTTSDTGVQEVYHDDYWTWYGSHIYISDYQQIVGQSVMHTHSVAAAKSININFIGGQEGTITIKSENGGSVELNGAVLNPTGVTTIHTNGSITAVGGDASVSGRRIDLKAGTGIGSAISPLRTNITDIAFLYVSTAGSKYLNTPEFNHLSSVGSQALIKYNTVRLANNYSSSLGKAGSVYQYLGNTATVNLSTANYFNKSLWSEILPTTQDVVQHGDKYYRYLGGPAEVNLGSANYGDTSKWAEVTARPSLKAVTTNGGIYLNETAGDLHVDQITATNGGTVVLKAEGAIKVAMQNSTTWYGGTVTGGKLNLTALAGGVGMDTTRPIVINSGVLPVGATATEVLDVTVSAKGNVFLRESSGNLLINQVITTGTVWIRVDSGSLIDANSTRVRDERSYNALRSGVWGSLALTNYTKDANGNLVYTGAAEAKILALISAYESGKQQEYRTFWQFHASYNVTADKVFLTPTELAYYQDFYAGQGMNSTDVANAIATIENARTVQYKVLKDQFTAYFGGTLPSSYNPSFVYVATTAKKQEIRASIKVWTEDELTRLVGAGLLKPVTSTRAEEEAPNIVGTDVTLDIVGGQAGNTTAPVTILLDGHLFTAGEIVAMAAAERADVSFLGGAPINATVNFTPAPNGGKATIRTSNGSAWAGLTAGMAIKVTGATGNTTPGLSYYTIFSVNGDTITLATNDVLIAESGRSVTILPIVLDPRFAKQGEAQQVEVTFKYNAFNQDGTRKADTITRTSGSWVTDGYVVGSLVRIAGSSANATGDEYFRVAGVTGSVLTLSVYDKVTTETTPATLEFTRGTVPTVTAIVIEQNDDVNLNATGTITATASGSVFLGSAKYNGLENTLRIKQVTAGNSGTPGSVRIKSALDIVNAGAAGTANIVGGNTILESALGAIGSYTTPFLTNLFTGGTLTARASGDVYISEHISGNTAGNMEIESVYSQAGTVHLEADGSIIDGLNNAFTKIKGMLVELKAGDAIGEAGTSGGQPDYLEVDVADTGTLTAVAENSIWIAETAGNMNLRVVLSKSGDVDLKAQLSILDAADVLDPTAPVFYNPANPTGAGDVTTGPRLKANVLGNHITLTAEIGSIGELNNDLDVNSDYSNAGVVGLLASTSSDNTFLMETAGDLFLKVITAGAGSTAFITNAVGSIYNGLVSGDNAISGSLWLLARDHIGSELRPITTRTGNIKGKATTGSLFIQNTGAVTVGGVTGGAAGSAAAGLESGGSVVFNNQSPVIIGQDILAKDQILIISKDGIDATADYVRILTGIKLITTGSVGSPLVNLLSGSTYKVKVVSSTTIQLLDSNNNVIDLSTPANTALLHFLTLSTEHGVDPERVTFDGSKVNAGANTINVGAASGLADGDVVVYTIQGSITVLAGDAVEIQQDAELTATSAIHLEADFNKEEGSGTASITVDKAKITAGTTFTARATGSINFTNAADIKSGTSMTLSAGANLNVTLGTKVLAGTSFTVSTGGSIIVSGASTITATSAFVQLNAGANFQLTGASKFVAGTSFTATVGGSFEVSGASSVKTGAFVQVQAGGDIDIIGNSTLEAATTIALRSTQDIFLSAGSKLIAGTTIELKGNYGAPGAGTPIAILLEGSLSAVTTDIYGGAAADTITLRPEALVGHFRIWGGAGTDLITLDHLPSLDVAHKFLPAQTGPGSLANGHENPQVRNRVDVDGQGGADHYLINTSAAEDILISIHDSGAEADGADVLTINGTGAADIFLVRSGFVAAMQTWQNVYRWNGSRWVVQEAPSGTALPAAGASVGSLFRLTADQSATILAGVYSWNGTSWITQIFTSGAVLPETGAATGALFVLVPATATTTLFGDEYERINYDDSINVLRVNGANGDDRFYVDDNSALTTLDGGSGKDFFQFGQVFGATRISPSMAAPGDEIITVETTVGFLSRGISFASVAYGGDGDDIFNVFSNKATLKLYGEDGNDYFVVRAFLLKGTNHIASGDTEVNGG